MTPRANSSSRTPKRFASFASRSLASAGEYLWGGAASTAFWIDPVEQVTVVFMTQLAPSATYPIRAQLRWTVNQALVD